MEKLAPWLVNADFEEQLEQKRPSRPQHPLCLALDYLPLLLEQEGEVLVHRSIPHNYLAQVTSWGLGGALPIDRAPQVRYWWGAMDSREKARRLNSKVTSTELSFELGTALPGTAIIHDKRELAKLDGNCRWIIKKPWGYSGRGQWRFSSGQKLLTKAFGPGPFIATAQVERVWDFSVNRTPRGGSLAVLENSPSGAFVRCFSPPPDFNPWKPQIFDLWEKIDSFYQGQGAHGELGADGLIYRWQGKEHLCFPLEVNARKTMGFVFAQLAKKLARPKQRAALGLRPSPGAQRTINLSPGEGRPDLFFQVF